LPRFGDVFENRVTGEHVHPKRFQVISGRLGARVDGVERTLAAGDEVSVPAGTPHDWWNAGDEDASVLVEIAPLNTRFLEMLATRSGWPTPAGRTSRACPIHCSSP
jgi:quercetin dioxygenase-like cupin family protein